MVNLHLPPAPVTPSQQNARTRIFHALRAKMLNWQGAETHEVSESTDTDPLRQNRIMGAFSQRQARHQRAFTKAFERYQRSARALIS
jgi:hypothetical protein